MTGMPEDLYTIREDYDPDGDLTADTDPVAAYMTYREEVGLGYVREMHFGLIDFERYIASLRERRPLG